MFDFGVKRTTRRTAPCRIRDNTLASEQAMRDERDEVRVQVRGRGSGWWATFGLITFGRLFLAAGPTVAGISVSYPAGAERAQGRVALAGHAAAAAQKRVEVLYRADCPEDARINGFVSLWLLPLVFSLVGLVITGIGTGIAAARHRSASVAPAQPAAASA
ncbi:DUF3592 domain-containing protein [Streptomyces sp. NPDC052225]|uniref:DUF3592 domain-containing protein n=1 Tax=Streptomyces sp. NPDC052225 TaxID=3154949 RepID=UPI00343F4F90